MLSQQVDGVLLATAARGDPAIDFLVRSKLPAVMVNRADESGQLASVVSDDQLAMRLAVDHLVERGCKHIAHLAGPPGLPTGAGRRQGFEAALRAHRRKPAGIVTCDAYSRDAGQAAARELLARRQPFDGLVCCNDLVALGAYDALREARLRIPRDVRVTGHNDMPLVDMVDPPLTTVRLPHRELGWRATQLLIEAMDGRQLSPARVVLRPELVVRASSA
jgi:LacI family transcriptional regulator